jgi:histidinol-phosphate aminotransferase
LQQSTIAAFARRLDVGPACVVLGNGADDVLSAITNAFVGTGDSAVTAAPTFDTYARAVAVAGGELRTLRYRHRWQFDAAAIIELADPRTTLIVLGHPNNPTNDPLDAQTLATLARALPNALIVVDEVYLAFSQRSLLEVARDYANVAVVGSLSKVGALAGLRVGYAVASPDVASAIRRVMPPFPVGAASLVAANAYASGGAATATYERGLARQIDRSLNAIVTAIRPRARSIWCGPSNFVLADFGAEAGTIEQRLARRGIAVRSFADPDLAGCLRFCALDERSTSTLVAALDA